MFSKRRSPFDKDGNVKKQSQQTSSTNPPPRTRTNHNFNYSTTTKTSGNNDSDFVFDNGSRIYVDNDEDDLLDIISDTSPRKSYNTNNRFTPLLFSSSSSAASSARNSANVSDNEDVHYETNSRNQSFYVVEPGSNTPRAKTTYSNTNDALALESARYNMEAHRQQMMNEDENTKMRLYNPYDERHLFHGTNILKNNDKQNQRKHEYNIAELNANDKQNQRKHEYEIAELNAKERSSNNMYNYENNLAERRHQEQLSRMKYNAEVSSAFAARDAEQYKANAYSNQQIKLADRYYDDAKNQRENELQKYKIDNIDKMTKAQLELEKQRFEQYMTKRKSGLAPGKYIPENKEQRTMLVEYVADMIGFDLHSYDMRQPFASDVIDERLATPLYSHSFLFSGVSKFEYDGKGNLIIYFRNHTPRTLTYNGKYMINPVKSDLYPGVVIARMFIDIHYEERPKSIVDRYCPRLKDCNIC